MRVFKAAQCNSDTVCSYVGRTLMQINTHVHIHVVLTAPSCFFSATTGLSYGDKILYHVLFDIVASVYILTLFCIRFSVKSVEKLWKRKQKID